MMGTMNLYSVEDFNYWKRSMFGVSLIHGKTGKYGVEPESYPCKVVYEICGSAPMVYVVYGFEDL